MDFDMNFDYDVSCLKSKSTILTSDTNNWGGDVCVG